MGDGPPTEGFWAGVRVCDQSGCEHRARFADAYGWWCHTHADRETRICGYPTGIYDVLCALPAGHWGGHVGPFARTRKTPIEEPA